MTFSEAKDKLDNMTDNDMDKYGSALSKLQNKIKNDDPLSADAVELALTAMFLYCKK